MRNWLFQGNPDYFAIDKYLNASKVIFWSVRQESFAREMQIGDRVFLWRAAGKERISLEWRLLAFCSKPKGAT